MENVQLCSQSLGSLIFDILTSLVIEECRNFVVNNSDYNTVNIDRNLRIGSGTLKSTVILEAEAILNNFCIDKSLIKPRFQFL